MTALLNDELGPFTVADWHALPERGDGTRLELLGGHWLVSPPPGGPHQWASTKLIRTLTESMETSGRSDLYVLGGIGVALSTRGRHALIPDFAVLNRPPDATSFRPEDVLLAGEIWSPGNTFSERRAKHDAYADGGIEFFWSIEQDEHGPVELIAYRLGDDGYHVESSADAREGVVRITACPAPLDIDLASLRP
ncbi:Uma2 family endonuclease [Allosaccharopolyspora coralli]|uniref:Uma2 family endonuclease n=1 Tax=Allosaccharopolyspora coralli TaxID=2665642 RepID=A0A5Q3Q4X0_9PSEU|nr:Uma2 family endonuclease [Allosaccharopolyspora coralli]QGK69502.1 Uma2 family endonuclease [Allosaccharopolyspora coralli]